MSQAKKEALINKPLIDLREMLERENKLLANKKFIEKLKDKGEKVRKLRDEIEKTIKIKQSVEETESFLAKLSLGEKARILPKHPMFSVNNDDMKLAKRAISEQQQSKEVMKEILNEEIDIYSIAISRTFDEELCQKRSERFIPSRMPNRISNKRTNEKRIDTSLVRSTSNQTNKLNAGQSTNEQQSKQDELSNQTADKMMNRRSNSQPDDHSPNMTNQKVNIFEKYKDSALEPYDKPTRFVSLSIESSLECGQDQKVKDFEVEKVKLENRLEWRRITEFDTDSESSDSQSENEDMDDVD